MLRHKVFLTSLSLFTLLSFQAQGNWIGRDDNQKQYYLQKKQLGILSPLKSASQQLEPLQNYFGTQVADMSENIDEWISDSVSFENGRTSRFTVTLQNRYQVETKKMTTQARFKGHLVLPNTEKHLHLLIETAQSSVDSNEQNSGAVPDANQAEDDSLQAKLRGDLFQNKYLKLSVDLGGSFKGVTPDPMVGLKNHMTLFQNTEHQNVIEQRLYWQNSTGVIFDNLYRHDWRLNNYHLFRLETRAIWRDTEQYFDVSQTLSLYDKVNVHRFFTYSIRSDWDDDRQAFHQKNIGVGFAWRERAYKKLIFVVLNPYLNYRNDTQKHQYYFEPSIELNIEFHFFRPVS